MDSWPVKTGLAGGILALVLSLILVPQLKSANPQSGDVLAQVMGGTADLAADKAYQEADTYFHAGTQGNAQLTNVQECAEADLPLKGWFQRMQGAASPRVHRHLDGAESKEILPWFVVATRFNPHHIEAWSTGSYWFYRAGQLKRAQDFISEGIRKNPRDYRLYLDRGVLHYHQRRWGQSIADLETALKLWKDVDEDSPYDLKAIYRYMGYARSRHTVKDLQVR